MNLQQAMKRITELEQENAELRNKLTEYENRDRGGRRKHDAKWQESYNTWVQLYEQGMTIMEIVNHTDLNRRTCYRYKSYYDSLRAVQSEDQSGKK